jgi:arylsulfatase A-like enzyme
VDDLLAPMVLPTLAGDENTIVIFTGDHGEEFWEHDTWAHGKSVYEPAVRVPLFIAAPGESPAKVDTPVSQVDLAPTILALAGLKAPATFQGRPLPLSDGGEEPWPIFVGSEFTRSRKRGPREDAIIVWPYKLIVKHGDMSRPGKYFNLRRDPGELKPLPEDKIAARLRVRIQSWKREVDRQGRAKVSTLDAAGAADLRALGYIE